MEFFDQMQTIYAKPVQLHSCKKYPIVEFNDIPDLRNELTKH